MKILDQQLTFEQLENLQADLVRQKKDSWERQDFLLLSEVSPVITLGRNADQNHLLCSSKELKENKIDLVSVNRGGDITYHGPGQLLIYPLLDLKKYGRDLRRYIHQLEQTVIDLLSQYSLKAHNDERYPGVWVNGKKIASLGVGCSQWITYHGLGLNVNTQLSDFFKMIVPCGLKGVEMTSLAHELDRSIDMTELKTMYIDIIKHNFSKESLTL